MATATYKHRSFLHALSKSNRIAKGQTLKKKKKLMSQIAVEKQQNYKTALDFAQLSVIFVD